MADSQPILVVRPLIESLIALVIAASVLLGSPGPATLSLAAVGATAGVAKGLPYLAGILVGLACAMAGAVIGVAAIFVQWPQAKTRRTDSRRSLSWLHCVSHRICAHWQR